MTFKGDVWLASDILGPAALLGRWAAAAFPSQPPPPPLCKSGGARPKLPAEDGLAPQSGLYFNKETSRI